MGVSEELLGQFIKETDKPVQIATKFGPFPWRFTGGSVSDALTASLRRLQLESIELYQVHWPFTFFLSQKSLMQALAEEYRRKGERVEKQLESAIIRQKKCAKLINI